jgi:hypothetical protein
MAGQLLETAMAEGIWETIDETLEKLSTKEKLELIERLARSVRITSAPRSAEQQRESLDQLRRQMANLPVVNPADGFSGRDHDQLLYGEGR